MLLMLVEDRRIVSTIHDSPLWQIPIENHDHFYAVSVILYSKATANESVLLHLCLQPSRTYLVLVPFTKVSGKVSSATETTRPILESNLSGHRGDSGVG